MPRTRTVVAVVALLTGCAGESLAKSDIDTLRIMSETEVRAIAVDHRVGVAHPMQTVAVERLENLGIQNVGQALTRMAGTQVRDYGGIGGMKTVSVHSLGASHTGVVYDGVPVSDCQAGQVDLGRFFTDNLGEVALSVGHEDDLLMSASSLASAAMVRISTATPRFASDKARNALRVTLKAGSWGEVSPTLMYARKLKNNDFIGVNATYQRADGHYPFTIENGDETLDYTRNNTDIECGRAELNYHHTKGADTRLDVKGYGFVSERGLPGPVIYYNNVSRERLFDANVFVQACLTKRWGTRWQLQARAKYNYSYNRYDDTNSKWAGGHRRDQYVQHEGYVSATALWSPHRLVDLSLAEDVRLNTLAMRLGSTTHEPNPTRLLSLTSLQARLALPHLTVNASLLLTTAQESVRMGKAMDIPARLSPSLALTVRPWTAERFFIRAMYKEAYRQPSFNELYYDRIGNTDLKPERATEWSVGLAWKKHMGMVRLSLTADGYFHRVSDKMVAMPGVYVWKMMNIGRADIGGLDATMDLRWEIARGIGCEIDASYTYQHATDETEATQESYRHLLPYTPRHSGNLSATVTTPWVSMGWNMQAMGERYAMKVNTEANKMGGFTVHDLNLWHEFDIKVGTLRAQLSICNIANRQYDIIHFYPMPGRHVRGTVTLTL